MKEEETVLDVNFDDDTLSFKQKMALAAISGLSLGAGIGVGVASICALLFHLGILK